MFSSLFVFFLLATLRKTAEQIFMKFSGKDGKAPVNKRLNFGGDPDHRLDTGIGFSDSSPLGDTRRCCAGKAMP